jgi:hypothetical protein
VIDETSRNAILGFGFFLVAHGRAEVGSRDLQNPRAKARVLTKRMSRDYHKNSIVRVGQVGNAPSTPTEASSMAIEGPDIATDPVGVSTWPGNGMG